MSYNDRINKLLKTMGSQLGTPLVLDASGMLVLTYGDGRLCTIAVSDADRKEVKLHTPVVPVHDASRRPLFETALRFNLKSGQAQDNVLGYDADRRQLVLAARIANDDPSVDDLSNSLSAFLNAAASVREELEDAVRQYAPSRASAPSDVEPETIYRP